MKTKQRTLQRATIADITRKTGLSHGTVSMALRNDSSIKEATRLKVQKVARELNYVPNLLAGSLSGGRTRIIGAMLTVATPDLEPILRRLQVLSEMDNYTLSTFFSYYDDEREAAAFRHLCQIRAEGVIWIPGRMARTSYPENARILENAKIATCILGIPYKNNQLNHLHVGGDKNEAYEMALDFLIKNNHRNIAFLAASAAEGEVGEMETEHLASIREIFLKKHLPLPESNIYHTDEPDFGGFSIAAQIANMRPEVMPSAVITSNSKLAATLKIGLETLGLSVPGDISIMSYAVTSTINKTRAQISGVDIQLNEHANMAWQNLTSKPGMEESPEKSCYREQLIKPMVIEGETVRKI